MKKRNEFKCECDRTFDNSRSLGSHRGWCRRFEIPKEDLRRLHWDEKKSLHQIAEERGLSYKTVWNMFARNDIPKRGRGFRTEEGLRKIRRKSRITPNFERIDELSYILGVLKGEGYIPDNNIHFQNTSLAFVSSYVDAMNRIGLNPRIYKHYDSRYSQNFIWIVDCTSIVLAEWIRKIGGERLKRFLSMEQARLRNFIRGFYEGEGCNHIGLYKEEKRGRTYDKRCWDLIIAVTDNELIKVSKWALSELGFEFRYRKVERKERKDLFELRSSTREQNEKFIRIVAPCIKNWIPRWCYED